MVCSRRDFSCLILKIESLLGLLFQLGTHFLELLQLFAKRKKNGKKVYTSRKDMKERQQHKRITMKCKLVTVNLTSRMASLKICFNGLLKLEDPSSLP